MGFSSRSVFWLFSDYLSSGSNQVGVFLQFLALVIVGTYLFSFLCFDLHRRFELWIQLRVLAIPIFSLQLLNDCIGTETVLISIFFYFIFILGDIFSPQPEISGVCLEFLCSSLKYRRFLFWGDLGVCIFPYRDWISRSWKSSLSILLKLCISQLGVFVRHLLEMVTVNLGVLHYVLDHLYGALVHRMKLSPPFFSRGWGGSKLDMLENMIKQVFPEAAGQNWQPSSVQPQWQMVWETKNACLREGVFRTPCDEKLISALPPESYNARVAFLTPKSVPPENMACVVHLAGNWSHLIDFGNCFLIWLLWLCWFVLLNLKELALWLDNVCWLIVMSVLICLVEFEWNGIVCG